jgi:diadenosine tetraphosphate (Ap4A) HIT family hydrolase
MFELDPRLASDTIALGDFPLCRLLLSRDANYPWFILVPRRAGLTELCDLDAADQRQFLAESNFLCDRLRAWFRPDKLNVAALGNVVSQLHVHHIARFHDDPAWPAPVWGAVAARSYPVAELEGLKSRLSELRGFPGFEPLEQD